MRRTLLALVALAALAPALPASAATCAGTASTIVVCVNDSYRVDWNAGTVGDCVYVASDECTPVFVDHPGVSGSGCLLLLSGPMAPEQYCEEQDD